ncbi:MAG: branched-chain amino acid ABC transporter permease [Phycisphaerae bacterium]|nr:branched-chain amino acid ABC transporter permease [Phycisphaerae bacterium]
MSTLRSRSVEMTPAALPTLVRSVWPLLVGVGVALALQFFAKPVIGDFYAKVLLDIGTSIILAVSLTMVNGFTGQFSIGHAAFMMVGGYVSGGIVYYGSLLAWGSADMAGGALSSMIDGREAPFLTWGDALFAGSLVAGGLVAAVCGYVVGLPSLRLKGDYLAIVTLGFGEIVRVLIQSQTSDVLYTVEEVKETAWYLMPTKVGGALGFSGLPFYSSLFWVFLGVAVTLLVAYRLKDSATGRAFLSIREDEIASEAMGVNTTQFKVRAFVIAAFFAGVAGGLFAHSIGVQLNPGELGFLKSFDIIIMVVLGGLGSISGAAIAAAIVTILPELLRNPEPLLKMWPVLAGLAAVLLVAAVVCAMTGRRARSLVAWMCIVLTLLGLGFGARAAAAAGHNLGDYRMILFALALILMMILRPQGLFGVREVWDRSLWKGIADSFRAPPKKGGTNK